MIWRLIEKLESGIDRLSDKAAKAICLIVAALIVFAILAMFYLGIPM